MSATDPADGKQDGHKDPSDPPIASKTLSIRSLGVLTSLGGLGALVGLVQTVVVAWIFGATRSIEIFFAATTFNTLLLQLASSGQVGDIFTPIFHAIQKQHGTDSARRAVSAMTNMMVIIAALLSIIATFFAPLIARYLVPGFSESDTRLCGYVFMATAPLMVLQVSAAMLENFLRAEHRYGISETLNLVGRIGNLVLLLVLGKLIGLWILVLGLWFGAATQLFGQSVYLYRFGYRHSFCLSTPHFQTGTVLRQLPFAFTHILSSQFFSFALTASLSYLPEGSYAAYNYARQLVSKFHGVVQRPISVLFFNRFSQAIAEGASRVREYADHALGLSIALNTLCVVPSAASGDLLLMGLWGSEKFAAETVKETHLMLVAISCLLYFSGQYLVTRRTNLALKVVARQFLASGVVLLISGGLCFLLVPRYGLIGAIMVQFISSIGVALSALAVLSRVDRSLVAVLSPRKMLSWTVSAAAAIAITYLARHVVGTTMSSGRLELLASGTGLALLSCVSCLVFSWMLGVPESREIFRMVIKRLGRRMVAHHA
nr:lipid II flippase MurJ [Rhodopirellula sp. SM50]